MEYILGAPCPHTDHDGDKCGGLSYLHDEDKELLIFRSRKDAFAFLKENRWSPNHVLVLPKEEGIFDE